MSASQRNAAASAGNDAENSTKTLGGATSAATSSTAAVSSPASHGAAPHRRRTGRRVIRQAGEAGAKLPVKVHESQAAREEQAREEAAAAIAAKSRAASTQSSETSEASESVAASARPAASTSKTSKAKASTRSRRRFSATSSASSSSAEAEDRRRRVAALADELFTDPGIVVAPKKSRKTKKTTDDATAEASQPRAAAAPRRALTSLLFQEPVLPAKAGELDAAGADDSDDAPEEQHSRRSRRRRPRSHSAREAQQTQDSDDFEEKDSEPRSRRRSQRAETETDEWDEDDYEAKPRRSHRRLNAEERAAADEVALIEEDIRREAQADDADDSADSSDDDSEKLTRRSRSSRSRRARSRRTEEAEEEADEEETVVTRRRRRSGSDSSARSRRSTREQQYIEKIKDVEGSTRLEAKRQRRRDNRRERSHRTLITEQEFLARRENVDRQMIVREKGHHTQISVIEDDILVEHYVSDIDEVSTVGNIYLGRVQNVLPSMEAAFVNIGEARNGVLYAGEVNWDLSRLEGQPRRIELAYKSGDPILVQVTKDPIGHKGARLTSQVTLAGRYIVLVPSGGMTGVSRKLPERERARLKRIVQSISSKDMGVIIRTAAEGASEEAITKDYEALAAQWADIQEKIEENKKGRQPKLLRGEPDVAIRVVRDIFNDDFRQLVVEGDRVYGRIKDYLTSMSPELLDRLHKWDPEEHAGQDVFDQWKIDGQLRKGMERKVYLPSGGSLVIDRTEAMTTIDVNTGRFIGKGKSLEETVTRCNLEAAEEIVRQLRLRDIGGMIMIDFVDMVLEENRNLVLRRLVECLSRDRTKHQVAEVTSLGLVQMTRKRVGQGLVEAFSEECPRCHGRGFIIHDEPTIDSHARDPYEVKGGDPFEKSRGRRKADQERGKRRLFDEFSEQDEEFDSITSVKSDDADRAERSPRKSRRRSREAVEEPEEEARPSSQEVREKLAAIAAAASRTDRRRKKEAEEAAEQAEHSQPGESAELSAAEQSAPEIQPAENGSAESVQADVQAGAQTDAQANAQTGAQATESAGEPTDE